MAEFVTGAMSSLIPKLGELLTKEFNLQKNIRGKIESLSKELIRMQAVLNNGEVPGKSCADLLVKLWADEVRELSYVIEDVVDKFLVQVDGDGPKPADPHVLRRLGKQVKKLFKKVKHKHGIAHAIKDIQEQLQKVSDSMKRYYHSENYQAVTCREIDPMANNLVGIDEPRDQDLMRLLSMEGDDLSVYVVGGVGKTTLAKIVYDKTAIIGGHFQYRAWIAVSQNYNIQRASQKDKSDKFPVKEEQISLGCQDSSLNTEQLLNMMDDSQLVQIVRGHLNKKRYLLVFDDVWRTGAWESLNIALPPGKEGSRVIVTTRIEEVAITSCSRHQFIFKVSPLSSQLSWELLCRRVFKVPDYSCPPELEEYLRRTIIVLGLPLAIASLGSMMSTKAQTYEWNQKVYSTLNSELSGGSKIVRSILSFSFYDLPHCLKACLLYLSLFPEDSKIHRDELIWMWIAEGFVHHENQGNSGLYELGESYFNELVYRSMIQPVDVPYDGEVYVCRMHDVLVDLICNLSREAKFVNLLDGSGTTVRHADKVRRLSLHKRNEDHQAKPITDIKSMRSLGASGHLGQLISVAPLSRFDLLRVLSLSFYNLGELPKDVGHLTHLRYLGLEGHTDVTLPIQIGDLGEFLEVLDLGNNNLKELPSTVCNLRRLIYLRIPRRELMPLAGLIGKLTRLQELGIDNADLQVLDCHIVQLEGKLTGLRLVYAKLKVLKGKVESLGMDAMDSLGCLSLKDAGLRLVRTAPARECTRPDAAGLKYFMFVCTAPCMTFVEGALPSLEKLNLRFCQLSSEDPLEMSITGLEHLVALALITSTLKRLTVCVKSLFQHLKLLVLVQMPLNKLKVLVVDLQWVVRFLKDEKLDKVPRGIKSLRTLKELSLVCHRLFELRIRISGLDYKMILDFRPN
uniref:Resistance protein R1 n=2 Tax=Curcuma zedoaria TaxID=136224 RepID=L0CVJ5_9LILI|nr:resistance protein R1 [Curcuma zedoaria]